MTRGHLSFKEFIFQFDVVSTDLSDEVDYADSFLNYLKKSSLDRKYQLVFPLFYDFKLSEGKKLTLFMNHDTRYQWWMDAELEDAVKKHSQYGAGITESYCKAGVKPSFLEMRKSADKRINVKVQLYDDFTPGESFLLQSGQEVIDKDPRPISDARSEKTQSGEDLDDLSVEFVDTPTEVVDNLSKREEFLRGIKSHYPILEKPDTFLYYFFSNNLAVTEKKNYGFGGLFVVSKGRLNEPELGFFMLSGYTLSNKIALSQIRRKARIEATKSAIAKAMARNMSHNIGSHVLSNLIKDNIYSELDDRSIRGLASYVSPRMDMFSDGKNLQLSFFLRYLKSRMDYMSEVTFGAPSLLVNRMIYGDVIREFDSVRILLNHISGVSNFKYQLCLKNGDRDMKEEDIAAAFPNDVLGCQAFYNIIENVIRNTAKHHSGRRDDETVNFTIRFKEIAPETVKAVRDAGRNLYCVEIDDGLKVEKIDDLVKNQNQLLNEPVLDKSTNNLRGKALGLLEMKASAAYLRQINLVDMDSNDYRFTDGRQDHHKHAGINRLVILKAFKTDKDALGYRFFVQKPKEFLLVGESWGDNHPCLLNAGIETVQAGDFLSAIDRGTVYAHSFIVYESCKAEKQLKDSEQFKKNPGVKALLPIRVLRDDDGVFRGALQAFMAVREGQDPEQLLTDFKKEAWRQLVPNQVTVDTDVTDSYKPDVVLFHHTDGFDKHYLSDNKGILFDALPSRTLSKLPEFNEYSKDAANIKTLLSAYLGTIVEEKREDIIKEIYKAYHNKVVIIDERVQKFAEENTEGDNGNYYHSWEFFESSNVFIPRSPGWDESNQCFIPPKKVVLEQVEGGKVRTRTEDIPLDSLDVIPLAPKSFDAEMADRDEKGNVTTNSIGAKLKKYIDTEIDGAIEGGNKDDILLLIHYGVLERMFSNANARDKDKKISELLKGWAEKVTRVVVTSGRGAHSLSLPDSVCFVNLSSVLYSCVENRNKYLINNLLTQARRKKDE